MAADTAAGKALVLALRDLPARDLNRLASKLEAVAAGLRQDDRSPAAHECRDALRRVQWEVTRRTRKAAMR